MTTESQRIAIAEVCETLRCPACGYRQLECAAHDHKVPDYLGDLNAMHEAEKVLSDEQWMQYEEQILEITLRDNQSQFVRHYAATAAQRAEAFLKCLGLWVEEPVSESTVEGLR